MTLGVYPEPPCADADDATYAALREAFHAARFYDKETCEYAGIEDLGALVRLGDAVLSPSTSVEGPLSALCHLFLWSRAIQEGSFEACSGIALWTQRWQSACSPPTRNMTGHFAR